MHFTLVDSVNLELNFVSVKLNRCFIYKVYYEWQNTVRIL